MSIVESEMKVTSIAPWFGGKRTIAPIIIAEAGEHRAWWEPMCGGVSVLLKKKRCRQEVLNDLHGDLTNLAIAIASSRWIDLYEVAARTLYSEGVYEAAMENIRRQCEFAASPDSITDQQLRRAIDYLILSWMGRNGAAGTERINYQFTLRYTNNGGDSATRWAQVVDSLPSWHARLVGVVISRRDAFDLVEKIDDAEQTVVYLDPPYLKEGDAYAHKFASGGGLYGDDHQRLAAAAARFKRARVIVSYYDHPRLADLYPGWTMRRLTMNKSLAAQNKRGTVKSAAPEVLLINGPSLAGGEA